MRPRILYTAGSIVALLVVLAIFFSIRLEGFLRRGEDAVTQAEVGASVYESIGYILNRAGESPQKLRTVMMLAEIPCPETEKLMDKMIVEGISKHTPFIMQYVHSNKMLCEQQKIKEQT